MTPQEIKLTRQRNRWGHILAAAATALVLTWCITHVSTVIAKAEYDYRMSCAYGAACEMEFE